MSEDLKCKDKVKSAYRQKIKDLKKLYKLWSKDTELSHPDLGCLNEYGLSFDYVDNSEDGGQSYFRYQISYGGPSEEFRIYVDVGLNIYKVEFWYLDWFDGAKRKVSSDSAIYRYAEFMAEGYAV